MQHNVSTLALLEMPLTFTQNELLTPEEFADRARRRGLSIQVAQLLELHRRGLFVPFLQLRRRGSSATTVPVAAVAAGRYSQIRSSLAMVIEGAQIGCIRDPATSQFRSWAEGLRLRIATGHLARYPMAFYSPYQLLGVRALKSLCREMSLVRGTGNDLVFHLNRVRPEDVAILSAGRNLAVLLSALDVHYLPYIKRVIQYSRSWEEEDRNFSVADRLRLFGLSAEQLARVANSLLAHAHGIDTLGDWYELVKQANPETWDELRGDTLAAMDCRVAAEILLRALDDLGRRDLSTPPPPSGRMVRATLDDRLHPDRGQLDEELTTRGLSPQPSLLLALEGKTEMLLMPRVLRELYGGDVPPTLVDFVHMDTVDRDLDLLVRHVLGLRLGRDVGNAVLLTRPATRLLIAVDPEKRYRTPQLQERERDKLARRLFETLPPTMRTPAARQGTDTIVGVTTWGTQPWEFANFTDRELALGILACVALPSGTSNSALLDNIATERARTSAALNRVANIDNVVAGWPSVARKVDLAEALWPTLRRKVRRTATPGRRRVPAARVGEHALQLALATHRRSAALRIR